MDIDEIKRKLNSVSDRYCIRVRDEQVNIHSTAYVSIQCADITHIRIDRQVTEITSKHGVVSLWRDTTIMHIYIRAT